MLYNINFRLEKEENATGNIGLHDLYRRLTIRVT